MWVCRLPVHIGPLGSCDFAEDHRKNGAFCRGDVGIDLPIVTWFVYRDWVLLVLICIMGGLILWKHRSNIARLISGTESKFSFHRKAAG